MTERREALRRAWTILAGEYPPAFGGVADYTFLVAEALAAAGDEVDVFAPGPFATEIASNARVHRLAHGYTPQGLLELRRGVRRLAGPRTVLVQYVAQSYGMRAVNTPFAFALRSIAGDAPLWIMFHEFAMEDDAAQDPARRIQAWLSRANAWTIARSAQRSFVSTSLWKPRLLAGAPDARIDVLPIPSNVPTHVAASDVAATRARFATANARVVGHDGTNRMHDSRQFLRTTVPLLCARSAAVEVVLLGKNGDAFAAELRRETPAHAAQIHATGALDAPSLARHIAACDVMVQPYGEGVTMRRGSLLGGLALGVPTVTTLGPQSEPLWRDTRALVLTTNDPHEVAAATLALLADPKRREDLAEAARALYASTFALHHTIDRLRESG